MKDKGQDSKFMIGTASTYKGRGQLKRQLLFLGIWILSVAAALALENNGGPDDAPSEYSIKAAYLYYFAKFVEWPASSFPSMDSPIIIGIVGDDPFGPILGKTLNGKKVQNRDIVIQHPRKPADLQLCHIVFFSPYEGDRAVQIAASLGNGHALTVCEAEYPARSKCMVSFSIEAGRVQFEIDAGMADKAGLKISSKLMMLSRAFQTDPGKGGR